MRRATRQIVALALLTVLTWLPELGLEPSALAAQPAAKPARQAAQAIAANAETVDISGRIAVGLDQVFIKDAQGYCLVQGLDLAPFAGRHIQAKAVVLRADKDYRTVRLLDYRVASPDDDSPGAARATARPTKKQ